MARSLPPKALPIFYFAIYGTFPHIHPSVHLSYKALVRRWSATEETQALTPQPNHPLLTQSLSKPPHPPPPPPPLSVRVKWSS